ncbi:kinase [Anaeramoeba flamelloides]|uniref:Kinase n=1 Tax=Anaeramoeba flamelloides TaxID=1746091 RepID=A0AAV7Z0R8_9EUKA|nr:kinase [Anaeramoeba flamelloides]
MPFLKGKKYNFYYMIQPNIEKILVAKVFQNESSSKNLNENLKLLRKYAYARHFAQLFNNKISSNTPKILFHAMFTYSTQSSENQKHFIVEPFFSNNNITPLSNQTFLQTIGAFQHFTYHYSNKQLLVTNLQYINGKFISPKIFSNTKFRFGADDLGFKGIQQFVKNHQCNHICKKLGLNII